MTSDEAERCSECAWCGAPSMGVKRTLDGVVRKVKGVPTTISTPSYAPACAEHMTIAHVPEITVVRASRAGKAGAWKRKQERMF